MAILGFAMICGFLILFGRPAPATAAPSALQVSGDITTNTTWALADSPIMVTGTVTVQTGTLTIQPGVEVRFNSGTELIIQVNGKLKANGTSGQPITFTPNTGSPVSCFWNTIRLFSNQNEIQHSLIEYGRWGLYIEPFSVGHIISNNTFRHNGLCLPSPVGAAIAGSPDDTQISGNIFTNNNSAIYVTKANGNRVFGNTVNSTSGTNVPAVAFVRSGLTFSSLNHVYSNTIRGASGEGIFLDLGADTLFTATMATACGCLIRTAQLSKIT
jgi:parallel beta-helix repeat protein